MEMKVAPDFTGFEDEVLAPWDAALLVAESQGWIRTSPDMMGFKSTSSRYQLNGRGQNHQTPWHLERDNDPCCDVAH